MVFFFLIGVKYSRTGFYFVFYVKSVVMWRKELNATPFILLFFFCLFLFVCFSAPLDIFLSSCCIIHALSYSSSLPLFCKWSAVYAFFFSFRFFPSYALSLSFLCTLVSLAFASPPFLSGWLKKKKKKSFPFLLPRTRNWCPDGPAQNAKEHFKVFFPFAFSCSPYFFFISQRFLCVDERGAQHCWLLPFRIFFPACYTTRSSFFYFLVEKEEAGPQRRKAFLFVLPSSLSFKYLLCPRKKKKSDRCILRSEDKRLAACLLAGL